MPQLRRKRLFRKIIDPLAAPAPAHGLRLTVRCRTRILQRFS